MFDNLGKKYFLTSGAAEGYTQLNAFDGALLASDIGNTNLIKMSSILPPACVKVKKIKLPLGAFVPVAYASITSDLPGEVVSAGIAVAVPQDDKLNGLIMEYSARGRKKDIEGIVRKMAEEGMKDRGYKIKEIFSKAVEHKVKKIGTAFAACVLWR